MIIGVNPKASIPLGLLVTVPFDPSIFTSDSCLAKSYYGNFNDAQNVLSIFRPDAACVDLWTSQTLAPSGSIAEASQEIQQLVWLEEVAVADFLKARGEHGLDGFLARLESSAEEVHDSSASAQTVMDSAIPSPGYEFLYRSPSAALLSVDHDRARIIDTLLPPFWKSTLLPTSPVSFYPVPPSSLKHVEAVLAGLKYDSTIASIVDNISVSQMKNDVRYLTGEDKSSGIVSRHSFSPGALAAAEWLKNQFEYTGATCTLKPFLEGFAPNVICRYNAIKETTATVLFSAHYDSRGSFGLTRAPGGDDDGSGTMAILSVARVIRNHGIKFHSNVELVAFAGEEQGLLGSRAYARELREKNANITIMVQSDMLAFRVPGEPAQLGFPDRIGSPVVTQLLANISGLYSPELEIGFTKACCSDHQSFHEQGFPASQLFERAGPIADPMYHNSGDLTDRIGYDFLQARSIAKVQLATILHTAGFELSD